MWSRWATGGGGAHTGLHWFLSLTPHDGESATQVDPMCGTQTTPTHPHGACSSATCECCYFAMQSGHWLAHNHTLGSKVSGLVMVGACFFFGPSLVRVILAWILDASERLLPMRGARLAIYMKIYNIATTCLPFIVIIASYTLKQRKNKTRNRTFPIPLVETNEKDKPRKKNPLWNPTCQNLSGR